MILEILLVIIIGLVILKIMNHPKEKTENEPFVNITNPFINGMYNGDDLSQWQLGTSIPDSSQILSKPNIPLVQTDIVNNVKKLKYNLPSTLKVKKVNKYFIDNQFNNDYRDVMTAIVELCPNQKKLFNLQELPVRTTIYTTDPPLEAYKLVVQFILQLNAIIKKLPETTEIINNYNNYLPLTSQDANYVKNRGINQFYNEIGVDFNLYSNVPMNAPVELIDIVDIQKEYTVTETKYIISFVIKKILKSVPDQMKLTVHFIMRNSPEITESMREQNVQSTTFSRAVAVEYIFTDGYFTDNFDAPFEKYGRDHTKVSSPYTDDGNFLNFQELGKNNLMSDHEILTEFNKKLQMHSLEMANFGVNVSYPVYTNPEFQQPPRFI